MTAPTLDRPTTDVAAELARLRDEIGLARDALRRAGYLAVANPDVPLHEAIDRLNADARAVIGRQKEQNNRLWTALRTGAPVENPNRSEADQ